MIKKILYPIIAILLGCFLAVFILELCLRFLPVFTPLNTRAVNKKNPIQRFQPNRNVTYSMNWNFEQVSRKRVNNFGFLSDYDYEKSVKEPLIAVIGDSYVEALQVDNNESFHGLLKNKLGDSARVYAFGSSGTALSGYLAYVEWVKKNFDPQMLIINIVGNDFDESWFKYRPAAPHSYFNPEDHSELTLVEWKPPILTTILKQSAIVRY